MKSKKSLCNTTLIRNDIHRFWPFLVAEVVLFQLFITLPAFSALTSYTYGTQYDEWDNARALITSFNTITSPFIPCILAIAVAIFVFGYLYKEKEAFNLHALPIRRETMFFSHYVTGLFLLLVPTVVTFLFLYLLSGIYLHSIPSIFLYDFVMAVIEALFFFHLACFVMMISGNHFISIVVYVVLNILLPGLHYLSIWLRSIYIYCITDNTYNWEGFVRFTPLYFFYRRIHLPYIYVEDADTKWNAVQSLSHLTDRTTLLQCILYLIPAIILLVFAIYLYKKRPVESVGEMMVFEWAKPVFRVIFTVCGTMLFAELIYFIALQPVLANQTYSQLFPIMVILIIVCGAITYPLSNAILYRSVNIARKTSFVRCTILIGIMVITMFATRKPDYSLSTKNLNDISVDVNYWQYEEDSETYDTPYNYYEYKIEAEDIGILSDIFRELQETNQNQPVNYGISEEMAGSFSFCLNYKDYETRLYFDANEEQFKEIDEILGKIGTKINYTEESVEIDTLD